MNIINEFFVSFILIKLYFKFKVCRKIKFPLLWKFYFSKWKFYFSADKFYDEKNAKFLPFLLPDSINSTGISFSESDKNKLIKEAKDEVKDLSLNLIQNLESKIHKSAKDTLEAIAKGFGAKRVEFEFKDNTQKLDIN